MPDRYMTKLRYSDRLSSSITVPFTGPTAIWYQTSLYDPQTTTGGHRPLWASQVGGLYEKYRVYGMKYKWTIVNASSYNAVEAVVLHQTNTTALADIETAKEQTGSRVFTVQPCAAGITYRRGYLNTAKVFGLTRKEFIGDDAFVGPCSVTGPSANPTKCAQTLLMMRAMGPGDITCNVTIDIVYYVEFMARRQAAGS